MVEFIAERIIEQADKSLERGKAKYRSYFITPKRKPYEKYRDDVETILNVEGHGECIVTE